VKAWGRGLGIPLRAFSVLQSGGSGILCPDDAAASRLSCRSVAMPAGYAAAVAVSGEPGDLVCRRWRAPA
jgi:4'-phosphopantetheinyl transferase